MGLTAPGDEDLVAAAATEFVKLCSRRGLSIEQTIQATISAAASALTVFHGKDKSALNESVENYITSFRSAIKVGLEERI